MNIDSNNELFQLVMFAAERLQEAKDNGELRDSPTADQVASMLTATQFILIAKIEELQAQVDYLESRMNSGH